MNVLYFLHFYNIHIYVIVDYMVIRCIYVDFEDVLEDLLGGELGNVLRYDYENVNYCNLFIIVCGPK